MPDLYSRIRPFLRCLPAEAARTVTIRALEAGMGGLLTERASLEPDPPILAQRLWALDFPNPIGLAAGYDKDARVLDEMWRFGFGFVEVGTVTPRSQRGNEKPRLFRLYKDRAIVNRMGFNSDGLDAVRARLARRRGRPGIVGLNLGSNRDSPDAAIDYEEGVRRASGLVQYVVINVSSPNTPGLRELQRRAALDALLDRLRHALEESAHGVPLLVKIAPDLTQEERTDIAEVTLAAGIDGLIVANTTIARPAGLRSRHAQEAGGLSGRPLFAPSTALLAEMYRLTGGRLPLIGVGGVASAADAYAKIRAGASLVQLYTALVFAGPALVGRIKRDLAALLQQDGFGNIAEAVGSGYPPSAHRTRRVEPAGAPLRPSTTANDRD